jgi:hypothetical protein
MVENRMVRSDFLRSGTGKCMVDNLQTCTPESTNPITILVEILPIKQAGFYDFDGV